MILLIDNYDSFTYNLYDYVAQLGSEVMVRRNDEITVAGIGLLSPSAIIISPGPGRPENAGITMEVIRQLHTTVPILGICLGYQALGAFFGAEVIRSPEPMHGKTSLVEQHGDPVFEEIPQRFEVMRYHSLNIASIPAPLELIAETVSGKEPMAVRHRSLPLYGFQFHPESILTPHGKRMLANWHRITVG